MYGLKLLGGFASKAIKCLFISDWVQNLTDDLEGLYNFSYEYLYQILSVVCQYSKYSLLLVVDVN